MILFREHQSRYSLTTRRSRNRLSPNPNIPTSNYPRPQNASRFPKPSLPTLPTQIPSNTPHLPPPLGLQHHNPHSSPDLPSPLHNAHDPTPLSLPATFPSITPFQQPSAKLINLPAWLPETCDAHDGPAGEGVFVEEREEGGNGEEGEERREEECVCQAPPMEQESQRRGEGDERGEDGVKPSFGSSEEVPQRRIHPPLAVHENQPVRLPQPMKINPHSGDVLAHLARKHGEVVVAAEGRGEEGFEREEVDLFVVWGEGRLARVVGVLDGGAAVGVVVDAEGGEESYRGVGAFGEGVGWGEGGCVD